MATQIQNQDGEDLAERIKTTLQKPQHRFELQDPFAETTYRFQTSEAATAKADELRASRFQARGANGQVAQISKVDGQWKRDDGKALDDIQAEVDKESIQAIEGRAQQRAAAGQGIDAETDKQMAKADAYAFRRIQEPGWQESAAVQMADNASDYPEYKAGLDKAIPGYPGTAAKVYALDAAHTAKVMAKEERKAAEAQAMLQESEDRAKNWTPEEAAKRAQRDCEDYRAQADKTERGFMRDDMAMNAGANPAYKAALEKAAPEVAEEVAGEKRQALALDPAALEHVTAARARDSPQLREAIGLNTVEPNLGKQQQQLAGEEETKRSAWLKKAEEAKAAQLVSSEKAASGNKLESDEIFTASQADVKPLVPPEIEKQYLRVGDKFYHPKNTDLVAFEDKGNRLETKSNSENIAAAMVRIAEARGWDEIKVSGSETFRKEVWLEAASRGMHVKGYSPTEQDKVELAKRVNEFEANQVEKDNKPFRAREKEAEEVKLGSANKRMAEAFANESPVEAVKKHPELAGAAAAVAVMDKKAEADGLTPAQRAVVTARVRQNVVNSIERGDIPEVMVKEEIEVKRDAKEEREYSR